MKSYKIDLDEDEYGIKRFSELNTKLIMYDVEKKDYHKLKEITDRNYQLTGIYFLIKNNSNSKNIIYIGESDNVIRRVGNHIHDNKKEFDKIIVIFSDSNQTKLDKDQIRFLEKELISYFKTLNIVWDCSSNKENGKNIKIDYFNRKNLLNYKDFIIKGLSLLDYKVIVDKDENNDEKIILEKENIKGTKVYLDNQWNNQKIEALFIPKNNKGNILISKGTKFKTKLKNNSKGNVVEFNRVLVNYKMKDFIEYDENSKQTNDFEVTFIKDSLLTPSGSACLIKGKVYNGWTIWKNENGEYINIYRN